MAENAEEMERVSRVVGKEGRLSQRAAVPSATGAWRSRIDAVNHLIEDLVRPTSEMARVIGAVAKRDLTQTVALEAESQPLRGEFLRTAKMVNAMVKQLDAFAAEVTRVAREVGTEGKLGGQAVVVLHETFPKTVEVRLRLESELPSLRGDPNQLHQAMLNLCLNARDAMPDGGALKIKTTVVAGRDLRARFQEARSQQYVQLTVTDTGFGIDEATKARIFEPFFTTKPQGQGTGLGLSVVYGIVAGHSGFIDVASEPGEGTTIDIFLPVAIEPAETLDASGPSGAPGRQRAAGAGQTILFVEDEPRQLNLMQHFLAREGFNILAAKDGAEAVQVHLQHKQRIDLVVLDLGVPKLNGWEAYKMMKEADPGLKAIFATGFMSREIEAHLEQGELSGVIMKPYQLSDVLAKICAAIPSPQVSAVQT